MEKQGKKAPADLGTQPPSLRGYPRKPYTNEDIDEWDYSVYDTDLGLDNLENDLPAADLQDL